MPTSPLRLRPTKRKLVGPTGRVIGVEFNEGLVKKANGIKEEFGANNVEFKQACWMTLDGLNIKSESIDLVVANGAVSRVPSVQTQLNAIYRVLKFGGEGENEVHGGPYPGCGNIPYSAEEVWE